MPTHDSDETTLWRRFLAGDDAAARRIESKYRPLLIRFLRRLGATQEQAEDVAQDVFHKVILLETPLRRRTAKGLLFKIAEHLWLDRLKKQRRLPWSDNRAAIDSSEARIPAPEQLPSERLLERERLRLLLSPELERLLTPKQLEVIRLVLEGHDTATIASKLGTGKGNVRQHKSMAVKRIRQAAPRRSA